MSQQPQDRPSERPATDGAWGASQGGTGPSTPVPYAGPPGTPMPLYDVNAAAAPQDHPRVLIAFILGIFSVVGFAVVGPVAWIMASRALKEMDRPGAPVYTNRGLAVAAKVLGIIGTIFLVLTIIAVTVLVVVTAVGYQRGA